MLTVLLKHVNPSIRFVATSDAYYNIKPFDRSCSQKVISIWQDVWNNGKIAVHRSRKHTGNFLKKIMMDALLEWLTVLLEYFDF